MNKKIKKIRLTGGILFILVLFLLVSPSLHADDVCFEALEKCSTKAAVAGIFNSANFLFYMSHCLMGYTWCLKYYV